MKDRSDDPSHHERTLLPHSYVSLPVDSNDLLNLPISCDEINKAVKQLKTNKAPGDNNISNEYIFKTTDNFVSVYIALFNLIRVSGKYSSEWLSGIIVMLF